MSTNPHLVNSFLTLLFLSLSIVTQAIVPPSDTFTYTNEGEFGRDYYVEYFANYRPMYRPNSHTFELCFYNTTPNRYILGLRMGIRMSESVRRWVWDANRGNPVGENATLTFGTDGNLVLADADGRVAWQTATSNKGVVRLELLETGNLVLLDKKGRFVWQSFDYPSDSLLVGQALRQGGTTKIVSRVSDEDGSEGPYSLVLEKERLALYLTTKNSPKPILYHIFETFRPEIMPVNQVAFNTSPDTEVVFESQNMSVAYNLMFQSPKGSLGYIGRPNYNSTLSFIRVGSDGGVRVYTYYDKVIYLSWDITYNLFQENTEYGVSECRSPSRCGSLGVCEDSQCVACPKPQGLLGWSKDCAPPSLPSCKSGSQAVDYYKVVGVEHFTYEYTEGDGPIKLADCREKCSKDCGCLGFFYREESSKCLLAPILGGLSKVSERKHVAYIKMSKK